jgi:dolichol kinase
LPIIRRHHILLVTLLLSNAIAMEALPLALVRVGFCVQQALVSLSLARVLISALAPRAPRQDKIAGGLLAIIISVTAVLFFGEVIPVA